MRLALVALAPVLILAGCARQEAKAEPAPAKSLRVIDGDTFELNGERIRVFNIDAPEVAPHSKCWGEAVAAREATAYLDSRLNTYSGRADIQLERRGRDRYGRTLAVVFVNGHDLGGDMVSEGYAAAWTGHRWDWCGPISWHAPGQPDVRPLYAPERLAEPFGPPPSDPQEPR